MALYQHMDIKVYNIETLSEADQIREELERITGMSRGPHMWVKGNYVHDE